MRKESFCEAFGVLKEFKGIVLSTNVFVMKYYFWCRFLLKENENGNDLIVSNIEKYKKEHQKASSESDST